MSAEPRRSGLWFVLPLLSGLAACQAPATGPVPPPTVSADGTGYIFLNSPVTQPASMLLMRDIDGFVAAGARTIKLAINSTGGSMAVSRSLVDYMNQVHARSGVNFQTHNVGLVGASAAYVFLAGQRRFAVSSAVFAFGFNEYVAQGPFLTDRLQGLAAEVADFNRLLQASIVARTRLSGAEAELYLRKTVRLNAGDALRDGIIEGILPFTVPAGTRHWTIAVRPAPAARAVPTTAAGPQP